MTGQTNNFFVSYAQGATNPNWTSNFSTDNVELDPGVRASCRPGHTSVTLTTTTSGDGYFLAGLNTAIPVPSVGLTKSVAPTYTTVGAPLTYTFTVTNTSAVAHPHVVGDRPLFVSPTNPTGSLPTAPGRYLGAGRRPTPAPGTTRITLADIAAGHIANTATAHALGAGR